MMALENSFTDGIATTAASRGTFATSTASLASRGTSTTSSDA
jgi:hypothetical protein